MEGLNVEPRVCDGFVWRLELFVRLFNLFLIPFSYLENKNSIYLCPILQSFPSVLR